MDDSKIDEYNALMRLAEFQGKRLDERRNHSWKIALAFWASILGSIALIEPLRNRVSFLGILAFGIGALLLHGLWLVKVFEADKRDKVTAFTARDDAMIILELEPPTRDIESRKYYEDWSVQFQFMTTAFLLIVVILIYAY